MTTSSRVSLFRRPLPPRPDPSVKAMLTRHGERESTRQEVRSRIFGALPTDGEGQPVGRHATRADRIRRLRRERHSRGSRRSLQRMPARRRGTCGAVGSARPISFSRACPRPSAFFFVRWALGEPVGGDWCRNPRHPALVLCDERMSAIPALPCRCSRWPPGRSGPWGRVSSNGADGSVGDRLERRAGDARFVDERSECSSRVTPYPGDHDQFWEARAAIGHEIRRTIQRHRDKRCVA